jgi:hypothetical protein
MLRWMAGTGNLPFASDWRAPRAGMSLTGDIATALQ